MKKFLSIFLVLTLLLGCSNFIIPASAAQIDDEAVPYEWMRLESKTIITYGDGYQVEAFVYYIVSTKLSNASGFQISSIIPNGVTKIAKWHSVETTLTINNITYYDNAQKAVLDVTYSASIGAGYNPYNATITLVTPGYQG